ncbi:MAG: DUF5615 family PIN-like protein [Candidatus Tectomicrobia bacterium]|uniref:DUF5615 family PIN-like protein n=1 Tax=Tectimicrobiota bacterium TaxID=2528274 RepID=A0A932HYW3_UNCTE|nr:DUF5615 family PIN-like protein [Candidatus Tectomicrobia bacterium]
MKFLLDVGVCSRSLHQFLADLRHDVRLASDIDSCAGDEVLLDLALRENRIILTEDKDFGELVFVHGGAHPAIVRMRGNAC